MVTNENFKKISLEAQDEIVAAIRGRENFEIVGCGGGNISNAVKWIEKAIESNGFSCRIYTKGRKAMLASLAVPTGVTQVAGLVSAAGMAVHNIATFDPDYEVMKRPVDNALRVTYVKTPSKIGKLASSAVNSVSEAWDKHVPNTGDVVEAVSSTAKKVGSLASDATNSVAEAWDKHIPSKETVVGTLAVSGLGPLVLNKEEIEAIGARAISATSKAASAVSDTAIKAANVVKENPGAAIAGAAVGVGAIAAAPCTGGGSVLLGTTLAGSLTGTGTVAAAIGASVTCAGAGTAISNNQKQSVKKKAFNDGVERGKAESAAMIKELAGKIERAATAYSVNTLRDDFIVSLAAIGFSMAACDGPISDEENACLEEFVLGASKSFLPQNTRDCLGNMASAPPDFEGAILFVRNFDQDIWPYIDALLQVVGEADGAINSNEEEFLDKWANYKNDTLEGGVAS